MPATVTMQQYNILLILTVKAAKTSAMMLVEADGDISLLRRIFFFTPKEIFNRHMLRLMLKTKMES